MTEAKAKHLILEVSTWEDFLDWMLGQTVGRYPDGSTDWYDCDVARYISRIRKRTKRT